MAVYLLIYMPTRAELLLVITKTGFLKKKKIAFIQIFKYVHLHAEI